MMCPKSRDVGEICRCASDFILNKPRNMMIHMIIIYVHQPQPVSTHCCCALACAEDSVPLNQLCALPNLPSSRFLLGDVPNLTPVTLKIFQMSIFYFVTKQGFECAVLFCPSFGSSSFKN